MLNLRILARLNFDKKKTLYICSFYRPPDNNPVPLVHLNESFNHIYSTNNRCPNILLTGDFNLPDII